MTRCFVGTVLCTLRNVCSKGRAGLAVVLAFARLVLRSGGEAVLPSRRRYARLLYGRSTFRVIFDITTTYAK